jgi:UDP-glucose 4-epimerase
LYINDVINIGSDEEVSVRQLADTVIRVTGSSSSVQHLEPLKEGDMTRRCPDNAKMREVLNRPLMTLEEGLNAVVHQWQQQDVRN